jgi:hypothetical protein
MKAARLVLLVLLVALAGYAAGAPTSYALCALRVEAFCPAAPQDSPPGAAREVGRRERTLRSEVVRRLAVPPKVTS